MPICFYACTGETGLETASLVLGTGCCVDIWVEGCSKLEGSGPGRASLVASAVGSKKSKYY